ncbi:9913_t:CDS:2 [Dentiscutata erythropus]|uniref:9913_t:CDS:1 n=1 Tax=Dentiscutata erythropus TaxID=1348616 RepID=A0A9N9JCS8_9GLOM|nr:9913_t:CDS:2 [Dentiscutata erythropus]
MIQLLPNELQIQILTNVITKTNFEFFCTLRTVCKKWNAFVPLIMHEFVISRLNSGLKFELTDWNETKWSRELLPSYDDQTKTFNFLFNNATYSSKSVYYREQDGYKNKSLFYRRFNKRKNKIDFIALVEKTENFFNSIKLGAKFGSLTWPEFVDNDMYKYEFDNQSNVCFERVIENKNDSYLKLYSFTIAAWKLYYILDCLQVNGRLKKLRKGFQYFNEDHGLDMRPFLVD